MSKTSELEGILEVKPNNIRLSQHVVCLVSLRDDLYDGSWELMTEDLKRRLEKRPYIPYIPQRVKRIERDLEIIQALDMYESRYMTNLNREGIEREPNFPFKRNMDSEPLYSRVA